MECGIKLGLGTTVRSLVFLLKKMRASMKGFRQGSQHASKRALAIVEKDEARGDGSLLTAENIIAHPPLHSPLLHQDQ